MFNDPLERELGINYTIFFLPMHANAGSVSIIFFKFHIMCSPFAIINEVLKLIILMIREANF